MITLDRVHKSYGGKAVLHNVSLRFPARRVTALIGPNGAGKSTLLMAMARLLQPCGGEIRLDGEAIERISSRDYARRVAAMRQQPHMDLRLTVEELVAFGRFPYGQGRLGREDRRAIDDAIAFLALSPLRQRYLDELSGGQRQMAFLAMSIAQQTDCLLLDEPLNNLDMQHAVRIMQAIRRLCDEQGRTVILVVHDINFAANYADHIVAMKHGRVHGSGPVEAVLTQDALRDLYGLECDIQRSERGYLCNYFKPTPSGAQA